jgi:hypothetical protein
MKYDDEWKDEEEDTHIGCEIERNNRMRLEYWVRHLEEFVKDNDDVRVSIESDAEMRELYHILITKPDDLPLTYVMDLYFFLYIKGCKSAMVRNTKYHVLFLPIYKKFDIELQEKIYVWDSATNKYIETWQKADYKGDEIKP